MIVLKKVTEEDLDTLTRVKINAFSEEFDLYGFTPEDMISKNWHQKMAKDSFYYKILLDGQLVGGVNIFTQGKAAYLCSLYIARAFQGKGVGRKVIEILEDMYDQVEKWQLETPSMSLSNPAFYKACGYLQVDEIVVEGGPENFSLLVFEKYK